MPSYMRFLKDIQGTSLWGLALFLAVISVLLSVIWAMAEPVALP